MTTDPAGRHDPGATVPLGAQRPGSTLADGRYELRERLGAGGMGLVFVAHDRLLGRDVAVKLLADNLAASPEARTRFEHEARSAARVSHPNVVHVYDVGEEDGRPYLVMELVKGPSLSDLLRDRGALPPSEVADVARQATQGLAAAHAAGLLHRDLKPGNLLLAPDGTVKVTDFGVAQATELPQLTRSGLVLGTLPYLAPERLQGAPASVGTDLYGLGATLLELLTGTPPGTAGDTDGLAALGPAVPSPLAGLVRACLDLDPARRPSSADDAAELLRGGRTVPMHVDDRADATRRLTADELTATRRIDEPVAASAPAAAEAADAPAPGRRPSPRSRAARPLVVVALGVLVLLVLSRLGDDPEAPVGDERPAAPAPADPGSGGAGDEPGGEAPPDDGPPPGDDPAGSIRELGEWLRDQVDD
jgi:hypothetical protein